MGYISVCRLCLDNSKRVHVILNTPLQEVYEKLTNISLNTMHRPVVACYLCHEQLRKAYNLMVRSVKADNLLTDILQNGSMITEKSIVTIDRKAHQLVSLLCTSPIEHILGVEPGNNETEVKQEPMDTVVEKKEMEGEWSEGFIGSPAETADITEESDELKLTVTDSEDDLPLTVISVKSRVLIPVKTTKVRKKKPGKSARISIKSNKTVTTNAREIVLTKEQQREELLERAKTFNYINSPYKCDLCYKGFVDLRAYENHKIKHDESSGPHECDICRMRYPTERHLRTHAKTSHGRKYECTQCSHRSHTANQAREHERWHNGHMYECQLCSQKFRKPTSYLTHMRKRHPSEHVCRICGDSFVGRHGLLMHISKTHKGNPRQEETDEPAQERFCSECNIQFISLRAWKRHIVTSVKHSIDRDGSSQCLICGEQTSSLVAHMREHERSLRSPQTLGKRAKIAGLPCEQCGMNFACRSKLQVHVKRIHLGEKYNKNIVCEVCGKHCTSNALLKYHQRTHTGEKPYACLTCTKRFADKNQLRIHIRTHTGERPYCCSVCGKRFSQKPALNRHSRVHTGAKPYGCQFCPKTFSQSNSLKLHVKTVHLKLPLTKRNKIPDDSTDLIKNNLQPVL